MQTLTIYHVLMICFILLPVGRVSNRNSVAELRVTVLKLHAIVQNCVELRGIARNCAEWRGMARNGAELRGIAQNCEEFTGLAIARK